MITLTNITYRDFGKFLRYVGCQFVRQKGSHRIYHRAGLIRPLVVPAKRVVSLTVIKSNLKTLGLSIEQFTAIMNTLNW